MNDGYHAVGSALDSILKRLNVATQDVVNANTPGYQKHVVGTKSFHTELDVALGREASLVKSFNATTFAQGRIVPNPSPYAMALDGPGMFVVKTPAGLGYTRNGDFTVNAQGEITTRAGYPVMGVGAALRIDPTAGPISIDEQGNVTQGEQTVGRLRLVEFERRQDLARISDTIFDDPNGTANPNAATRTTVRNGALEVPKGSTVSGMVAMIDAARQYEAAQRVAKTMDDSYERLNRQG